MMHSAVAVVIVHGLFLRAAAADCMSSAYDL